MTVHTTRLRTLPCSTTSLLVLASGLFVTPVSVAGQTDYSAITGRVVNVETMAPIPNVLVASSRVRTVTDATGAFRLRLPAGSHLITVRGLGYGEVTRPIDLAGDTVVQFHLRPDPVVLEGLTVVVQTLERQWQRYGQRGLYLRQADLLDYFTAAEAVRARTRRLPARQRLNIDGTGTQHEAFVLINDQRAFGGLLDLDVYHVTDIHSIQVFGGTTVAPPMFRVYTVDYVEWLSRTGRRPPPLIVAPPLHRRPLGAPPPGQLR
jgi:hypothetical protein